MCFGLRCCIVRYGEEESRKHDSEAHRLLRDANANQIHCCLSLVCKTMFDATWNEDWFATEPYRNLSLHELGRLAHITPTYLFYLDLRKVNSDHRLRTRWSRWQQL
jgi:hypothetical protein